MVIINDDILTMDKQLEQQIKKSFGTSVRAMREQKGLSQEGLALLCGLDRTYIGGVERGERNISLINIHKVAKAIGVNPKELFQ
jgi:transcriptional regulator with XRE-family HTH domain